MLQTAMLHVFLCISSYLDLRDYSGCMLAIDSRDCLGFWHRWYLRRGQLGLVIKVSKRPRHDTRTALVFFPGAYAYTHAFPHLHSKLSSGVSIPLPSTTTATLRRPIPQKSLD